MARWTQSGGAAPARSRVGGIGVLAAGLGRGLAGGCSVPKPQGPNADGLRKKPASYPSPYPLRDPGIWVDNGMLRVRATRHGISWFDVFHPEEGQWYLAKNNLNFVTRVDGKWENSEIERLLPDVEVARVGRGRFSAGRRKGARHG